MQKENLFALLVVIMVLCVGITEILLRVLSFKTYTRTTDLLERKARRVATPEDVINLIIAEAKKMGVTPNKVVVTKNSAFVDFNRSEGNTEESKE